MSAHARRPPSVYGYCIVCGAELTVRDPKPDFFSSYDGESFYRYRCPNRPRWWSFTTEHSERVRVDRA